MLLSLRSDNSALCGLEYASELCRPTHGRWTAAMDNWHSDRPRERQQSWTSRLELSCGFQPRRESPRSRADPAAAELGVSRHPTGSTHLGEDWAGNNSPAGYHTPIPPGDSIPPYRASRGDDGRATMMSRGSLIPLGRSNLRQKLPRPPHVVPVALSEPRFGCEERFFEARPFVCHRDAGNETHDENDV